MAQTESSVEVVWGAFRALSPEARDRFMERLVTDVTLREELEDLLDLEIVRQRASEPVRPLEDVLAELDE